MPFDVSKTLLVALIFLAAGCGSTTPAAVDTRGVLGIRAERCRAGAERGAGSERVAVAAVAAHPLNAFRSPGRAPFARFEKLNPNGVPTVFSVRRAVVAGDCSPRWYRVQLPQKPNGVEGWVRAADVEVARVRTRIDVDLSARRLILFRDGKAVLAAATAIGSAATPTPTGRYYVNQRLVPSDPSGPFGPGAIGISAFSDVLTGWTQGGPIAIHGTNQPWSIGRAVSNGCLRVRNDVLRRLFRATLAGTPVTIHV